MLTFIKVFTSDLHIFRSAAWGGKKRRRKFETRFVHNCGSFSMLWIPPPFIQHWIKSVCGAILFLYMYTYSTFGRTAKHRRVVYPRYKMWRAKPPCGMRVVGWAQDSFYDYSSSSLVHKLSFYVLPAPPALKLSVNETYVVDPGQDVTMSCEVTAGFPTPTVTWARYPNPLPRRATIRGGSLTLRSVTPAESGFYNCTAVNNVGNPARRNVNLIVRSMCTTTISIYTLYSIYLSP